MQLRDMQTWPGATYRAVQVLGVAKVAEAIGRSEDWVRRLCQPDAQESINLIQAEELDVLINAKTGGRGFFWPLLRDRSKKRCGGAVRRAVGYIEATAHLSERFASVMMIASKLMPKMKQFGLSKNNIRQMSIDTHELKEAADSLMEAARAEIDPKLKEIDAAGRVH